MLQGRANKAGMQVWQSNEETTGTMNGYCTSSHVPLSESSVAGSKQVSPNVLLAFSAWCMALLVHTVFIFDTDSSHHK